MDEIECCPREGELGVSHVSLRWSRTPLGRRSASLCLGLVWAFSVGGEHASGRYPYRPSYVELQGLATLLCVLVLFLISFRGKKESFKKNALERLFLLWF